MRPEHLNCVNTPEGIRRINEMQRHYDADPEEYERREREQEDEEREYAHYLDQMAKEQDEERI